MDEKLLVTLRRPADAETVRQSGATELAAYPDTVLVRATAEQRAAIAARPVFELFGKKGPATDKFPEASQFVGDTLGYYMHDGGHGTVPSDWDVYLKFMKAHLKPGT